MNRLQINSSVLKQGTPSNLIRLTLQKFLVESFSARIDPKIGKNSQSCAGRYSHKRVSMFVCHLVLSKMEHGVLLEQDLRVTVNFYHFLEICWVLVQEFLVFHYARIVYHN